MRRACVAVWQKYAFAKTTVWAERRSAISIKRFNMAQTIMLISILRIASLLEEDIDGTFFKAGPEILMYCVKCGRQLAVSELEAMHGPYCRGKFFKRHKKEPMLDISNRDQKA
jgi:hypothetical protein